MARSIGFGGGYTSTLIVKIRDFMRKDLISVETSAPVIDAIDLMVEHDIGAVIVTENRRPVGMLTERDFLKRVCIAGADQSTVTAGQIMSKPLITIKADASLYDASELMMDNDIRRLLVEDKGEIVGFFTQKDLVRKIMDSFLALHNAVYGI